MRLKLKKFVNIDTSKYSSIDHCFKELRRRKIVYSAWIENIYKNKRNKIKISKKSYNLYRVKVSSLGFKKATTLKQIYTKMNRLGLELVNPDVALIARLKFKNQKIGEWIRFATPLNSMIDSDGIPHLPKLGQGLGKLFIETYWSYPHAIFHPHNDFVVAKKSDI